MGINLYLFVIILCINIFVIIKKLMQLAYNCFYNKFLLNFISVIIAVARGHEPTKQALRHWTVLLNSASTQRFMSQCIIYLKRSIVVSIPWN